MGNIYIELPAEEQLRIAKLEAKIQKDLIASHKGKDTTEVIISLLIDHTTMVASYESDKWFTAERNKNTTNDLVLEYEAIIDQLKKQIK